MEPKLDLQPKPQDLTKIEKAVEPKFTQEEVASRFCALCEDTEKNVEEIVAEMIKEGFPKPLVELLPDFRGKIAETQQALSTAKAKPKAADQLRAIVLTDISEYFQENEATITTFFEVNKQPREYLRILSEVFSVGDISNLPIQDLKRGLESFVRLRETATEQFIRAIGLDIEKMLSEKLGLVGSESMKFYVHTDGVPYLVIFYPNGSIKSYTQTESAEGVSENLIFKTMQTYFKENNFGKLLDSHVRIASKGDITNKTSLTINLENI